MENETPGWFPISDAPDDQRSILAVHRSSGIMRVCWRVGIGNGRSAWDDGANRLWQPTHWRHLPAPPAPHD